MFLLLRRAVLAKNKEVVHIVDLLNLPINALSSSTLFELPAA